MIDEMLMTRALPALPRDEHGQICRNALLDALRRNEYGDSPPAPDSVRAKITNQNGTAYANKAIERRMQLSFDTPKGEFGFPFVTILPKRVEKPPVFLYINFRPDLPDCYLPVEELLDHGYAIATFCYTDVTKDVADDSGIACMYDTPKDTGWGKIGMWAFAASRVMDYLQTQDGLDLSRVAVSGHSRLGKTALWCGAQDERFSLAISNNSGCAGAALHRGKIGERIAFMSKTFPYWFCGNYKTYAGRESELPYDQHFLLALLAPRAVYVASAQQDEWADPTSEFLSCVAASLAWAKGLVQFEDALPAVNLPLSEGRIGYHVRAGSHFHSRTDWLYQLAFRARQGV